MDSQTKITRIVASSTTKIARTQQKILSALETLLDQTPPEKILLAHISDLAGVNRDLIYKGHHRELRQTIEDRLRKAREANAKSSSEKRLRINASKTAEAVISDLQKKVDDLSQKTAAAMQTINVLSQIVGMLSKRIPSATLISLPQKGQFEE